MVLIVDNLAFLGIIDSAIPEQSDEIAIYLAARGRLCSLANVPAAIGDPSHQSVTSWANVKSPTDRLFTAPEGTLWRRDMWAAEVRSAIAVHNKSAQREPRVPTEASAYSFRHRISELLQLYGVDPLTVAAQTGTSLRMIERPYFKFIRSAMLEKLAGLQAKSAGQ